VPKLALAQTQIEAIEAVISPIEKYGKTTALRLIEQLAYEPNRSGGTPVASIYHQLEHRPGITSFGVVWGDPGLR
jgi:hypothetical protein